VEATLRSLGLFVFTGLLEIGGGGDHQPT